MQKKKKILLGLIVIFAVLLGLTVYTSFSTLLEEDEIVIKSMTPLYDETSDVIVDQSNVIFNDKNQIVKYNVVLENTQDYDVKITDIALTTPTEEFLQYTVEDLQKDDVLAANSTKELTISLETMGIKGWGRNFADELTANISFEKVVEEVTPPVEDDNEEDKQPEVPVTNIKIDKITNNTIVFKDGIKVEDNKKVETWIYPETKFYGYNEADESNIIKEIVLKKEKLSELEITPGEHNIVLSTEEKEVLGYVNIYINEDKELLKEKPEDITNKEENKLPVNKPSGSKPSTNNKDEAAKEDNKVENPYTSDKGLLVVLVIATGVTGLGIILVTKNKFAKYTIFIIALSTSLTLVSAEKVNEISIKTNASFESQNVMTKSHTRVCIENGFIEEPPIILLGEVFEIVEKKEEVSEIQPPEIIGGLEEEVSEIKPPVIEEWVPKIDESVEDGEDDIEADICTGEISIEPNLFWSHSDRINNIYIQNEITEIDEYEHVFDVSKEQNGRVMAYLVDNEEKICSEICPIDKDCCTTGYDLYLQADGIIYPNEDASYYFAGMRYLNSIDNLEGLDTSNVTNMGHMFYYTGYESENFTLDLSNFDTSNVTNMAYMFAHTGYNSTNLTLDLRNFDTGNVTDMNQMFWGTGYNSSKLALDLSNFDTSNVTTMNSMFAYTGYNNQNFTLDVSKFDTSSVTNMGGMFAGTGFSSANFTLDVSNFDTSKVTNMTMMFAYAGYNNQNFTLDVSKFDTSSVTTMDSMFARTGYNSTNFTLDTSNFDTSYVEYTAGMFYETGYNSESFNTSITIRNPNMVFAGGCLLGSIDCFDKMFKDVATKSGTKITVNYTSETSSLVDQMIASKSENSNIVKGSEVEIIERKDEIADEVIVPPSVDFDAKK